MWNFWKRRKKEPEFEMHSQELPMSTLFRWYCYDLKVENPNRIAEAYGLTPISEEGEQMEKKDSLMRTIKLMPYLPFLETMSEINAMVIAESQNQGLMELLKDSTDTSEEELEELMDKIINIYKALTMSGLIAAFSSALELGLVSNEIGWFTTKETDIEDDF